MLTFKSMVLSAGLVAGVAFAAQAQSDSVASLPPTAPVTPPAASSPVGYPGPNPGSGYYGGTVTQQQPVTESPKYVGPSPGAVNGPMPPKFEKSADYDTNPAMHPYSNPSATQTGPRPH